MAGPVQRALVLHGDVADVRTGQNKHTAKG